MSSPPAPNVFLAPSASSPGPETPNADETVTPAESGPSGTHMANGDADVGDAATDEAETNGYGRESMYVTLFDEMITTVLESESYLFTPREEWVLRYILSLPYGPHYLLTRLLLRRPGKVHAFSTIVPAYSSELGEEGVKRAARALCVALAVPEDIVAAEPEPEPEPLAKPKPRPSLSPLGKRKRSEPAVPKVDETKAVKKKTTTPWADIPTGLSEAEERADPDLAEAIRQSLWAERGGVEVIDVDAYVDANGAGPSGPRSPPETPQLNRSQSEPSMASRAPSILPEPSPSLSESTPDTDTPSPAAFSLIPKASVPITRLARSEADLSLDDLMSCVSGDDLRRVARARKIPLSALSTRESTMRALRDAACRQTTLGFAPLKNKGKGRADAPGVKRSLSAASTSEHLVVAQLLPLVGEHVIQIDAELYALVARVNLIFSRTPPASSTVPALILPPILVQSHKRHYPDYGPPTRSRIWADRDELLTWQRVTDWEALVSDALGDQWAEQRRGGGNPGWGPRGMPPSRTDGAKMVRKVWEEAWPIWQRVVAEDVDGKRDEPPGLAGDRFRTAHVLTRIVYKGAEALGVLHEYDLECVVLRSLLAQRRWRRGRRGAWYERLALVLMNHFKGSEAERTARLEDATQVCIDGLLDDDTHLIYRPSLSRRLTRLENKLNLPADERHISYAQLLVCETRELYAPRVQQNAGKPAQRDVRRGDGSSRDDDAPAPAQVGKSVWAGREGEVTVEGWVLEWWEDRGYSGYHAESSILTTLFALLVWPVLFHPLPGAFETRYQTAPLDLGTDTFASARRALLDARLAEMENTSRALEMLRDADARERPRGTWAVGLSWDFGATELAEIVTCLGGPAVAAICRMLSEEYRHRASGVPDLIVWSMDKGEARFVEVKGPGDTLSETQKIWIDVLLSAGVPVEVCRVRDKADEARDSAKGKGKAGKKRKSSGGES